MFFGLFKNNKEPEPITIIGEYEVSHPKFSHSVFNANPKCDEDGVVLEKHYSSNTDSMETTATSLDSMSQHQNRRSLRNAFLLG